MDVKDGNWGYRLMVIVDPDRNELYFPYPSDAKENLNWLQLHGFRSYSRILSKSWHRLMPRCSAVLVRLPLQCSKARWIARRSTSASRAPAAVAGRSRRSQ